MLLIWWTNDADWRAINELPESAPEYLRDEFKSRIGRPGRGRLWSSKFFMGEGIDPWPGTPLGEMLGKDYGGIVIYAKDADHVRQLPGIITDTELNHV